MSFVILIDKFKIFYQYSCPNTGDVVEQADLKRKKATGEGSLSRSKSEASKVGCMIVAEAQEPPSGVVGQKTQQRRYTSKSEVCLFFVVVVEKLVSSSSE